MPILHENWMAVPVIIGRRRAESERFAGALETLYDRSSDAGWKSFASGTSHFLGQNFAKAFDVQFTNAEAINSNTCGQLRGGYRPV